ncbi:MAG: flagellar hook-length control protein FliK [Sedimentisphaerales bacterium]|nr:flagellar hook-length control protein FliK [Sedimentisphaerales bacterium]
MIDIKDIQLKSTDFQASSLRSSLQHPEEGVFAGMFDSARLDIAENPKVNSRQPQKERQDRRIESSDPGSDSIVPDQQNLPDDGDINNNDIALTDEMPSNNNDDAPQEISENSPAEKSENTEPATEESAETSSECNSQNSESAPAGESVKSQNLLTQLATQGGALNINKLVTAGQNQPIQPQQPSQPVVVLAQVTNGQTDNAQVVNAQVANPQVVNPQAAKAQVAITPPDPEQIQQSANAKPDESNPLPQIVNLQQNQAGKEIPTAVPNDVKVVLDQVNQVAPPETVTAETENQSGIKTQLENVQFNLPARPDLVGKDDSAARDIPTPQNNSVSVPSGELPDSNQSLNWQNPSDGKKNKNVLEQISAQQIKAVASEKPAEPLNLQNVLKAPPTDPTLEANRRENIEQVVKAARTAVARGSSLIQIRLNPPELGFLRIEIKQNANGLHLLMQATSTKAQQLLQQNSQELQAALESHGLQTRQIDIQLRLDLRDNQNGSQTNNQPQDNAAKDDSGSQQSNAQQQNNQQDGSRQKGEMFSSWSDYFQFDDNENQAGKQQNVIPTARQDEGATDKTADGEAGKIGDLEESPRNWNELKFNTVDVIV